MGQPKGCSKKVKKDQPKRKRYNAVKRGFWRRVHDLERHIAKNPQDTVAQDSLPRVRKLVTG